MHAVEREAIFQIRKPKVTHAAKKRSDRVVEIIKDHYCGRGSKATGGGGRQKVTHVAKKRSDRGVEMVKDHYCGRGSEATGGRGRQKVTHAAKN